MTFFCELTFFLLVGLIQVGEIVIIESHLSVSKSVCLSSRSVKGDIHLLFVLLPRLLFVLPEGRLFIKLIVSTKPLRPA